MPIIRKSIPLFSAKVSLGLERGYTGEVIDEKDVIRYIQELQNKLIQEKNLYLSVSLSKTNIVMSGQNEAHLVLNFINYPKFPLDADMLKKEIELMTVQLMHKFEQNRIVIEYLDETIMLEKEDKIDPRIIKKNKI